MGVACHAWKRAGKFGGDGLAEDHRAGGPEHRHRRRIRTRPVALIKVRAVFGRHVHGIEHIFDTHRNAVQWARRRFTIPGAGLGEGQLGIDKGPGVDITVARIDSRQTV